MDVIVPKINIALVYGVDHGVLPDLDLQFLYELEETWESSCSHGDERMSTA